MAVETPFTPEQIAERERRFYERSKAEALASGFSDWIEDGDGTMWLPGSRGSARAFYAGECGFPFTKVRAKREYMRISLQAIRDLAADMAPDENYEDDDVAYTWEGEGWLWELCDKDAKGALGLWRCEGMP